MKNEELSNDLIEAAKIKYKRTIQHCLDLIETLEGFNPALAQDNNELWETIEQCEEVIKAIRKIK